MTSAPEVGVSAEELDLREALARLGPEHREIVDLFYAEDLAIDEIATVICVAPGTVKSRLFHARQFLKSQLGV